VSTKLPIYSIALLSATALAYEILLVRLFAIIQWHHYAYMVISLALLGYGASGTFLAFTLKPLLANFRLAILANMTLFGLSTLTCFLIAQSIPFNPDEVAFDARQWRNLVVMYLTLSLPFFFVANAIGLALANARENLSRVYAADLIGAGTGSLAIILLLFTVFPLSALQWLSVLGIGAALIAAWETRLRSHTGWLLLTVLIAVVMLIPGDWLRLSPSPYKDLSQTLRITGTRILEQRTSPLGLISVIESPRVPLRHAPGLSLNATNEPPEQLGIFIDGNGPSVINRVLKETSSLDYLNQLTSALPYHLGNPNHILIPGSGGGSDVLQALHLGTGQVDAVELNPQIIDLVKQHYGDFAGDIYNNDRVQIISAEVRGFLHNQQQRYDLIQLPLLDSFSASSTGLDYLYTLEAFEQYLQHLTPAGMLAINRWVKMPPRDMLKVFATVTSALERQGLTDIPYRLALIRGWQTSTLLVKNSRFSLEELAAIRRFSEQRSFDLGYLPDMTPTEANRFNILPKAYFYQSALQLLGDKKQQFLSDYKFNLQPATDNQPYFFHFFRWSSLPEIVKLYGQGGVPLIDTGYLVMTATLVQAIVVSLALVLLPLLLLKRRTRHTNNQPHPGRVFVYFSALGLAFLFTEIAFIQKLTLFLHHPLYAVAVSLAAFLLFAGLGSGWSRRLASKTNIMRPIGAAVLLCLLYLFTLDFIFAQLIHLPDIARILISIILIAPLAFCLGMPFPIGLEQLARYAPEWLPWAWGINGCASVISAVLATLLAIHFGFNTVLIIAMILYVIAAISFPLITGQEEDAATQSI
jgi:spermidine synthase